MKLSIFFSILIIATILVACELVVIGSKVKKKEVVKIDRTSSMGAIYLFKSELDSGNIYAATSILADSAGNPFRPIEQYERYYDMGRMKRIVSNKNITDIKADTISEKNHFYSLELNYLNKISFMTEKLDTIWYIIKYE